MSARALLFLTTSIFCCSIAAPAMAQDAPAEQPVPADPNAPDTQETPSTSVSDSTQPESQTTGDEIIVTGVRASLQGAQDIKRRSTQVVDSIVAEDIGKLPDNTVSDALQRVTGIQVQRGGGEATTVLIRGLPRIQSLVNGREVFTGTGRGVVLADIPAELVAGIDVYKTTTPELIEGSTSGLIDIRLRRPLDFSGMEIAGSLRGIYGDQSDKWSYIGSGLFSNRWKSAGGTEFGLLVGASFNKRKYEDQTAFNFGWQDFGGAPDAQPFVMPLTTGGIYNVGDRERPAANVSLQFRPNEQVEFHLDGVYTGYREDFDVNFFIGIPIAGARSNFVRADGTPFAESVTSENNFTLTSKQAFRRKTDGYQIGAGGSWENGPLRLSADLNYNDSKVKSRALIVDTFFIAPRIDYQFDDNGTPNLDVQGIDVTDPDNFTLTTLFDNTEHSTSEQVAGRADAVYELGAGFLQNIKAGVRLARRTGEFGGSNPSPLPIRPEIPVSDLPGSFDISPGGILNGRVGIDRFLVLDSDYLYEHIDEIRAAAGQSGSFPDDDPNRVFKMKESTTAGYVQTGFNFNLGAMPVDGVIGARIVNTKTDLSGFQVTQIDVGGVPTTVVTPINGKQDYTDFLPSLSLRARLTDELQARFVAGKAITRAEFSELNPAASLMQAGNTTGGSGMGGNPNLDRIKSDNYDASLEWYFSRTGSLTLAAFRRDLDGYIVVFSEPETFGLVTYSVARPRNTSKGKLQGLEFAYQQFFDFLPGALSGLGAQVNLTYVDSSFTDPTFGKQRIPQVSKYSYNLVAIYEKYGLTARLAYNWRSRFTDSYIDFFGDNDDRNAITVAPLSFLDFSASYQLTDNLTLTMDATNLLDETYRDQFGTDGVTPRDTRAYDRTFGGGIRFRF